MNKKVLCKILSIVVVMSIISSCFVYGDNGIKKDESVFVTLKADGSVKERIVSDWLHSDKTDVEIEDKSILNDVVNIKGDEVPHYDSGIITWESDKNDIFYQGSTNKDLPISVKITYKLDGKHVSPEELAGKSGKLGMKIELTNKDFHEVKIDGVLKTIYTPFTAVVAVNMPNDVFKNINVNSGEIFSDGNNQVATFISFPGMSKNFSKGSEYIDLPQTLEISADVDNFKMGPIMITATPKLPDVKIFKESDKISDLIKGIDELKDASNKLKDASGKIAEGQKKVADNVIGLNDGVYKLYIASGDLKDGVGRLSEGAKNAKNGAVKISEGVNTLGESASKLGAASNNFANGCLQYSENALKFTEGAGKLAQNTAQLGDKTAELSNGINTLSQSTEQIINGQKQITAGAEKSIKAVNALIEGKKKELAVVELLIKGLDGITSAVKRLENVPLVKVAAKAIAEGLEKQKAALVGLKDSGVKYIAGLNELEAGVQALADGSKNLQNGLSKLQEGQKKAGSAAQQLAKGTSSMKSYADQLAKGSDDLSTGANKLSEGAEGLSDGMNKFSAGSKNLIAGSKSLAEGLTNLDNGTSNLYKGTVKLNGGLKSLSEGTSKLSNGTTKLADSTKEFNDGMKKFNDEGIEKLHSRVKAGIEDIDDIIKTKDEIVKLSQQYGTFTGLSDNMDGSVKFIMKTDEIKTVDKDITEAKKFKTEKKGFFQWIKGLFAKK